ncbi:MAG TPA: hypothetical protein VNW97_23965 [Candidatus Saccharimonadales bacterium]|jgi:hypothetical protein|nr:hypothetical protein [Candidatus Saccharimonadales bacterium]
MNIQPNDDEKFENFLKQFRPRTPRRLPVEISERANRRPFFLTWSAAAAAVLMGAVLLIHHQQTRIHSPETSPLTTVERPINPEPLTIRTANTLLLRTPTDRAALNGLAFRSPATHVSKGKHSALAVLSQENIEL